MRRRFYFYDAIAPIVDADSHRLGPRLSRLALGQGRATEAATTSTARSTSDEYRAFVAGGARGQKVLPHAFEEPRYFEGCLPIEVMAERGDDVLAFGPMKPVGLDDRTRCARRAAARREPLGAPSYNLVGFQTRLDLSRAEAHLLA